jgi:Tfp pilus assembly protein PilO
MKKTITILLILLCGFAAVIWFYERNESEYRQQISTLEQREAMLHRKVDSLAIQVAAMEQLKANLEKTAERLQRENWVQRYNNENRIRNVSSLNAAGQVDLFRANTTGGN